MVAHLIRLAQLDRAAGIYEYLLSGEALLRPTLMPYGPGMGERGGETFEEPSVRNDVSGTVNGPVGQFGSVHGDVHMHWAGHTSQVEYERSDDDEEVAASNGLLRAAGLCAALALASTLTFGIITGQWLAPLVLSVVGAVVLYRWITPSAYDSYEEETGTAHEYWETWEYSEHWEWETWEED
ncbi:hypothetical protein ABTY53_04180 [Streptomyces noursei]|uniref:hypothetical protein n=1 Tax=Streptomyces noursei TaxID=1971 RepID=UPI00332C32BB